MTDNVNQELLNLAHSIKLKYHNFFHYLPVCFPHFERFTELCNLIKSGKFQQTDLETIKKDLKNIDLEMNKIVTKYEQQVAKNIVDLSRYVENKTAFIKMFLRLSQNSKQKILFLADIPLFHHNDLLFLSVYIERYFTASKKGQEELQQLIDYISANAKRFEAYLQPKSTNSNI